VGEEGITLTWVGMLLVPWRCYHIGEREGGQRLLQERASRLLRGKERATTGLLAYHCEMPVVSSSFQEQWDRFASRWHPFQDLRRLLPP